MSAVASGAGVTPAAHRVHPTIGKILDAYLTGVGASPNDTAVAHHPSTVAFMDARRRDVADALAKLRVTLDLAERVAARVDTRRLAPRHCDVRGRFAANLASALELCRIQVAYSLKAIAEKCDVVGTDVDEHRRLAEDDAAVEELHRWAEVVTAEAEDARVDHLRADELPDPELVDG